MKIAQYQYQYQALCNIDTYDALIKSVNNQILWRLDKLVYVRIFNGIF